MGIQLYDYPYQTVKDTRLVEGIKIWQPDFPGKDENLPPYVFRTFNDSISKLKKGDVLLIRHNQELEVDPYDFADVDVDFTIRRADENCLPILIPVSAEAQRGESTPALFKIYGGQLTFENLMLQT